MKTDSFPNSSSLLSAYLFLFLEILKSGVDLTCLQIGGGVLRFCWDKSNQANLSWWSAGFTAYHNQSLA